MLTEFILLCLLILILWFSFKKPSNYPPGPWGVPLFGSIPLGLKQFEEKLHNLRKEYGDIVCWRIGSRVLVFLFDFKTVKEAFSSPVFASRPKLSLFSFLVDADLLGLVNTNGHHWQSIRRFALRHLRDLGMGKSKMETAVQFEATEFVKEIKKTAGTPTVLPRFLKPAVINVLWQMIVSKRYDYNDKKFLEFDNVVVVMQNNLSKFMLMDVFTWIEKVLPKPILDKFFMKNLHVELSDNMKKYFQADIDDHISKLDENNSRDFIDDYLIEMNKQKSDPDSVMSTQDLIGCIADLFGAGTETTTATINYSMLYMAKFPEAQRKLQKEIDEVLPNDTLMSLDDKPRLPYTEAFINEILRISSLIAFGVPRTVLNDTQFKGYTIPKDAVIMSASEVMHFDPSNYESSKDFYPERFLNDDGKFELPKTAFLPFGIGKRQCIGESLARMELLIFLTTMVKYLNFSAPPNKEVNIRPMDMPMFNQPRVDQEILITTR